MTNMRLGNIDDSTIHRLENGMFGGSKIVLDAKYVELANETTTTTVTEDIPVLVSHKILETALAKRVVRKIFPTDGALVGSAGVSIRYPGLNTTTWAGQTEAAVSITPSSLDTDSGVSSVTATPELYMAEVDLTNQVIESGQQNWMMRAGQQMGRDYAVFEDKRALGTFYAGATTTVDKTSNGWDAATGGQSNLTDDILGTLENIEVAKFNGTHLFVNTVGSQYVRKHSDFGSFHEFGEAIHKISKTDLHEAGIIGQINGMSVVTSPNVFESTSFANSDTYLIADADFAGGMVDKRPLTIRQKDFPELDEVHVIGSALFEPIVWQPTAFSGKTDFLSPS